MSGVATTAVVHLVRQANPLGAFASFLASYRRYEAGLEHDLVLLFKGFPDATATASYLELGAGAVARAVAVPDAGYDLGAYRAAAGALPHMRLCFVNSFSEILAPGWLARLSDALEQPGVGAAGASGSWASLLSYSRWQLGLPDPYARACPDRAPARHTMHEISGVPYPGDRRHSVTSLVNLVKDAPVLSGFPAAHLRTNAFLMRTAELSDLRWGALTTKRATHVMESGRRGLTAQLHARGRRAVVADRQGAVRDWPDWAEGSVFWQERQQDLLVADNQTRLYAGAPATWRRVLAAYAWGDQGRPA